MVTTLAVGAILGGCVISNNDSFANDTSATQVSEKQNHEQLLKEAKSLAEDGKQVSNIDAYKKITSDEVHKVLGESINSETDGDVVIRDVYKAKKYALIFHYKKNGKSSVIDSIKVEPFNP